MSNLLLEIGVEDLPHTQAFIVKKILEQTVQNLHKYLIPNYKKYIFITHRRFTILLTHIKIKKNTTDNTKNLQFSIHYKVDRCTFTQALLKTSDTFLKNIHINVTNKRFKVFKDNKGKNENVQIDVLLLKNFKEILAATSTEKKKILEIGGYRFIRPLLHTIVIKNYEDIHDTKNYTDKTFKNRILDNTYKNNLKITTKNYVKTLEKNGLVIPSLVKRIELCRRKITIIERTYNITITNGKKLLIDLCMSTEYPNVCISTLHTKYIKNKSKFLLENIIEKEQSCFLTVNADKNVKNILLYVTTVLVNAKGKHLKRNNLLNLEAKLKDLDINLTTIYKQIYIKHVHTKKKQTINNVFNLHFTITYTKNNLGKTQKTAMSFLLNLLYIISKLKNVQDNTLNLYNVALHWYRFCYNKNTVKILQNVETITNYVEHYKKNICLTALYISVTYNFNTLLLFFNTQNYNIDIKDPFGIRNKLKKFSKLLIAHKLNIKKITKVFKKVHMNCREKKLITKELIKRIITTKKKIQAVQNNILITENIHTKNLIYTLVTFTKTKKRIINLVKFTQNSYKIKKNNTIPKKNLNIIPKFKHVTCKIFLFIKLKNYKKTLVELIKLQKIYNIFLENCNVYSADILKTKQYVYTLKKNINILKIITL